MINDFFGSDSKSTTESIMDSQSIIWAPFVFQTARVLRNKGILNSIQTGKEVGKGLEDILTETKVSKYGLRVLLDAGIQIGVVRKENDKYILTKTGYFINNDKINIVDMNFVHDVCYKPIFHLEEAIEEGKPSGLKEFGSWETVYEGLSQLPEDAKRSWFEFDHYYSDIAFPQALKIIFDENKPKRLMDIGGNTGKWAMLCANYDKDVEITILDLPGQLAIMEKNVSDAGLSDRIKGHPIDLLVPDQPFPKGHDAIWMSQFLCCFSEEQIIDLLTRSRKALNENGRIYIQETFTDRPTFPAINYSLDMTSLYFTVLANGNSRMYPSEDFMGFIAKAGLEMVEDLDLVSSKHHTILVCKPAT